MSNNHTATICIMNNMTRDGRFHGKRTDMGAVFEYRDCTYQNVCLVKCIVAALRSLFGERCVSDREMARLICQLRSPDDTVTSLICPFQEDLAAWEWFDDGVTKLVLQERLTALLCKHSCKLNVYRLHDTLPTGVADGHVRASENCCFAELQYEGGRYERFAAMPHTIGIVQVNNIHYEVFEPRLLQEEEDTDTSEFHQTLKI